MPSQFPAFRLTVARQMEAYRERIARRIQQEAARHGQNPLDLAHEIRVHPSTVERWFRGDRTPQRRHRTQLAEHWDLPLDAFEPDLVAEERKLGDQLSRIESKLDRLLDQPSADRAAQLAADAGLKTRQARARSAPKRGAKARKSKEADGGS